MLYAVAELLVYFYVFNMYTVGYQNLDLICYSACFYVLLMLLDY